MSKHKIDFARDGHAYAEPEQTLLEASLAAGIPLYHVCGGQGKCSTCRVVVNGGAEHLTAPTERERELRARLHLPDNVRLACQTRATGGPVRLNRILRDDSDLDLYVGEHAARPGRRIGEERDLVLLFLDIRNFTPFIERHLAFDVIHIVRKLFNLFQDIVERHAGRIVETAGDGIYAAFGFDCGLDAASRAAVDASFAILQEVEDLNAAYFVVHFEHTIEVGIGIHRGRVIMGNIRLGDADHLVIMGYPVNIAARLQDATKQLNNNFLVSRQVYAAVADRGLHHAAATVELKGVKAPFEVVLLGNSYTYLDAPT